MDKTYVCEEALSLQGTYASSWRVTSRTVIESGDIPVQTSQDGKTISIACLKFTPNANSDNLHVTFDFNFTNMQTSSVRAWFVGLASAEAPTVRPPAQVLTGYQTFAANSSYAITRRLSFDFSGDFRSGNSYYLLIGMAATSYNRGILKNVNDIVMTAENVSGSSVCIWSSLEAEADTVLQTINAGSTYRSLEGFNSSAFVGASSTGIGNQNIVGIGQNENTGTRLYFNAVCIPVEQIHKRVRSVKIRFQITYNSTGTHKYRWAISTLPPGVTSPYINTLNDITENEDPQQIARGTFHDYDSAYNEYTFFADIPPDTDFYIYLWSFGNDSGQKRYGNFHIRGNVEITLTTAAESGMGWVQYTPYIFTNGAWEPCEIKFNDGTEWN